MDSRLTNLSSLLIFADYYFRVRKVPWASIYSNPFTFATQRTSQNIWIDMSCGNDFSTYPTATTVNTCLTNSRPLASMNIALNTGPSSPSPYTSHCRPA